MDEAARLITADAVHCTATWRNMFVVVWRQPPEVERVRAFRLHLDKLLAAYPEGIGFLVVMQTDRPIPSSEVRAAASGIFKSMGKRCLFQAVVYESSGLAVTLLRATLRGFAMVSASQRVCLASSVGEAAEFGAPLLGGRTGPIAFKNAVDSIVRMYDVKLAQG